MTETTLDGRRFRFWHDAEQHANPVAGLHAEFLHEHHGWQSVRSWNRRAQLFALSSHAAAAKKDANL